MRKVNYINNSIAFPNNSFYFVFVVAVYSYLIIETQFINFSRLLPQVTGHSVLCLIVMV